MRLGWLCLEEGDAFRRFPPFEKPYIWVDTLWRDGLFGANGKSKAVFELEGVFHLTLKLPIPKIICRPAQRGVSSDEVFLAKKRQTDKSNQRFTLYCSSSKEGVTNKVSVSKSVHVPGHLKKR